MKRLKYKEFPNLSTICRIFYVPTPGGQARLSVMLDRVKQLKNWDHPSVMLNRVKHLNTSTVR